MSRSSHELKHHDVRSPVASGEEGASSSLTPREGASTSSMGAAGVDLELHVLVGNEGLSQPTGMATLARGMQALARLGVQVPGLLSRGNAEM